MSEVGKLVRMVETGYVDMSELANNLDKIAFVERVNGLAIEIPHNNTKEVEFQAIGLVGEYNPKTKKVEPIKLLIGSTRDVESWLNSFGGMDVFEYVRYDEYVKILELLHAKIKENEELTKKIEMLERKCKDLWELAKKIEDHKNNEIRELKKYQEKYYDLVEEIEKLRKENEKLKKIVKIVKEAKNLLNIVDEIESQIDKRE